MSDIENRNGGMALVPLRVDDVGFLLDLLLQAMEVLEFAPLPAAISAGRYWGKSCPLKLDNPDLKTVIDLLTEMMGPDLEMNTIHESDNTIVQVDKCPIRDICHHRKMQLGGQLCTVFHHYIAGIVSEYLKRSARAETMIADESRCLFSIDTK